MSFFRKKICVVCRNNVEENSLHSFTDGSPMGGFVMGVSCVGSGTEESHTNKWALGGWSIFFALAFVFGLQYNWRIHSNKKV